jgi:plastocyanin
MKNAIFRRALVVCFGGGVLVSALSSGVPVAQAEETNAVVIKNFMFEPMAMTVKAGATVTWKNLDGEPHTVVNDAGIFRSAALDQNDTYQFKFDKPGVYKVFCGIHPNMKETITVQ